LTTPFSRGFGLLFARLLAGLRALSSVRLVEQSGCAQTETAARRSNGPVATTPLGTRKPILRGAVPATSLANVAATCSVLVRSALFRNLSSLVL
jgi:hypothetical protein